MEQQFMSVLLKILEEEMERQTEMAASIEY